MTVRMRVLGAMASAVVAGSFAAVAANPAQFAGYALMVAVLLSVSSIAMRSAPAAVVAPLTSARRTTAVAHDAPTDAPSSFLVVNRR